MVHCIHCWVTGYSSIYNIVFLSLKINFVLANSADPDEMPHNVAFLLGLHCLPKYLFKGFRSTKGLSNLFKIIFKIIHFENNLYPLLMQANKQYGQNYNVPPPLSNDLWIILFQKVDA